VAVSSPDRGVIAWNNGEVRVIGFETVDDRTWHLLAEPVEPAGPVRVSVDPE
jgi:Ser-tRNA(Ala) deacylase AlaX